MAKWKNCGTLKGLFYLRYCMKVINLFGAPGAGKSTAMLGITYKMKMMGLSVENTPEFFKEMIYEDSKSDLFGGQLYVLGEQNRRLARLKDKNDFAITDCPIPLIGYYTAQDYVEGFHSFVTNLHNTYDNYNYFILREHEFETEKRVHDEETANIIETELPAYLEKLGIQCITMRSGDDLAEKIIEDMVERNIVTLNQLARSRNDNTRKWAEKLRCGR